MEILKKPILPKNLAFKRKNESFGFIVDRGANKLQIKQAVEQMYNVVVTSVNTANYMGKVKGRFTKAGYLVGRENNTKKVRYPKRR